MKIPDRIWLSERRSEGGYPTDVLSNIWDTSPSPGGIEYQRYEESDDGDHESDCNGGLNEQCDCTRIATRGELRHMLFVANRELANIRLIVSDVKRHVESCDNGVGKFIRDRISDFESLPNPEVQGPNGPLQRLVGRILNNEKE